MRNAAQSATPRNPPSPAAAVAPAHARATVSARPSASVWSKLATPAGLFVLVSVAALYLGWRVIPLDQYLTPERGIGYGLGITGGSLMLLLLLYPARKRARWLRFMGSVKAWFQLHMVMGVVGPLLVLYHANFSFGSMNSNVALVCMLLVSGSGLVGRYFYAKIHEGLYGHENTLAELQQRASRLRHVSLSVPFMPELLECLDEEERQIVKGVAKHLILLQPLYAGWLCYRARWRLDRFVRRATRTADHKSRMRLRAIARAYVRTRIVATRRVSEYQAYVRLFSWWHVLHLPLFVLLLIAGIAHVIAVHVY